MVLWARNAVRSVLATALRMPKKAAPPPKKEKAARDTGPVLETAKPGDPITINYLKAGKDPLMMEDTEYPDWLWGLLEPPVSRRDLEIKFETEGKKSMSLIEIRRLVKLTNRERIKEHNNVNAKD
mmetsp:Transcript_15863/g.23313  ORF Transcript_15863/g.23313 Transcript_15863/m.23313 type:complete len:125 (+) Transcript_15863:104-478(+)